uniref:Phosphoribosyltransferase domain-containing protein n=1 Tax=Varanus komodoensis TaxID=61221 RepID=A0A8D2J4B7_VARKO
MHSRPVRAALASAHQGQPLPKTLSVLESTPQVRGMHTIIRNKDTRRDEFIFYSKRLMRLLIEHALSFLPLKPVTVETPQGTVYEGKRFHRQRITGVSILRAGETMEQALTAVCKDIRLGKILIQTNHDTGEPELHYLRLPKEIGEDYVILMDSTVSTGAAAMMAVRVLLDHDVQEDKIFLLSLLMAEMGVHSVAYAFPRVRIITTAVDKRVSEEFHIIPGIGEAQLPSVGGRAGRPNRRGGGGVPSIGLARRQPLRAEPGGEALARTGLPPTRAALPSISRAVTSRTHVFPGNFGDRYFGTDGPVPWCESDSMDC